MEVKDYLKIIKNNLLLVGTFSLAGVFLALLLTRAMPQGFQQTRTFFLSGSQETAAPDSQSLGTYYNQEKARNFTDTAVAVLESADFKGEVQVRGGNISIRKMAPQVIRISTTAATAQEAQSLMQKTFNTFNSKISALTNNQALIQLKEVGYAQPASQTIINKKIFASAGLLLGFALSILALSLKTYFKL